MRMRGGERARARFARVTRTRANGANERRTTEREFMVSVEIDRCDRKVRRRRRGRKAEEDVDGDRRLETVDDWGKDETNDRCDDDEESTALTMTMRDAFIQYRVGRFRG